MVDSEHDLSPDSDGFAEYVRQITLTWAPRLGFGLALGTLLWWPLDMLLYADDPELRAAYGGFRGRLLALVLVFSIAGPRVAFVRRHAVVFVGLFIATGLALVGWWVAVIGKGDSVWLHYTFLAPQLSVMLLVPVGKRCGFSLLFALIPAAMWALNPLSITDSSWLMPGLSYLVFSAAVAAGIGHALCRVIERGYRLRVRTDRQRGELAELARRLESRVADQTRSLRDLHARSQGRRAEQRTEIARELHDGLGQELTSLRLLIGLGGQLHSKTEAAEMFGELDGQVDRVQKGLRRILVALRPQWLDDLGLVEALRELIGELERRSGVAMTLETFDVPEPVPAEIAVAAYRIAQEGLNNALRHARASHVTVALSGTAPGIRIEVADDGKGMSPGKIGLGLGTVGILERAAALGGSASWTGDRGTRLVADLPIGEAQ